MMKRVAAGYIQYRYICEQCGAGTDWIRKELFIENDRIAALASRHDASDSARRIKNNKAILGMFSVLKRNTENGDYSEFEAGARCPNCAARQSWLNPVSISGVIVSVAVTTLACVFAGVLVGFFVNYFLMAPGTQSSMPYAPLVGFICGLLISFLKAVLPNIKDRKAAAKTEKSAVKNLPDIDWDVFQSAEKV